MLSGADGDAAVVQRIVDASVFPRIQQERVILDLRTILPGEEEEVVAAVQRAGG